MYRKMMMCGRADLPAADMQTVTICAGEACDADYAAPCAAAAEPSSLPHVHIEEQVYEYGFSPEEALQRGTLFPELVN